MCGIYGFLNKTDSNLRAEMADALRDSVFFNLIRGMDALGFMKVRRSSRQPLAYKDAGIPTKLLERKEVKDFIAWAGDNRFIVGHNRHATKGDRGALGAHPFIVPKKNNPEEHIALMHNGTLTHIRNEEKYVGAKSDSHILAKMLASGRSMAEVYADVWGALAIVWYDSEDYTLNFFRNSERPFGFAIGPKAIFFGSELYLLGAAADRHNIEIELFQKLPVFEHWKYHLEEQEFEKIKVPLLTKVSPIPEHQIIETDWEDCLAPFANAEELQKEAKAKKEVPKSTNTTSGGSPPGGRTAVIPYNDSSTKETFSTGLLAANKQPVPSTPPRSPNYRSGGYSRRASSAYDKPHWTLAPHALGYTRGEACMFSLSDFSATKRSTQTDIVASLVIWNEQGEPILRPQCTVRGMIGAAIQDVDKSTCLYQGTITQVYIDGVEGQGPVRYMFNVKDIKELTLKDPFRQFQAPKATKGTNQDPKPHQPPVENPTPKVVAEKVTQALATTRKAEEREFADSGSSSTGVLSVKCADCQQYYPRINIQRIKLKTAADGEATLLLNFCGQCWKALVCDDSRLDRIFKEAKQTFALASATEN